MQLKNTYKSKIIDRKLSPDVFFASIDNHTNQTDTVSKTIHSRFVQFYFCLKGSVTFHFTENYSRVLEEGQSFLIYQPEVDLPLQISVSAKSRLDIVVMSIAELHQLFSNEIFKDVFSDVSTQVYEQQPISVVVREILSTILQIDINPKLQNLLMRNRLNELLFQYFGQKMDQENSCPYLDNEQEAQKIHRVKEVLINDYSITHKIADLAHEVTLSEYKLKEGFKQLYGKTISQYMLQHRMQKGKSEIEKKNRKIKEIALDLGYDNPSHFIEAFKRTYGITPKQYEKSLGK